MPVPNSGADFVIVSARISPETSEKLDRYLHFVNQREPGLNVKLSTIVRMLIVRGLDQVEKEYGALPPVPKSQKRNRE